MESYRDIKKNIQQKENAGFYRYQEALAYLKGFSVEEIRYIEMEGKIDLASVQKRYDKKGNITFSISIAALFLSVLPDFKIEDVGMLFGLGITILVVTAIFFMVEQMTYKEIESIKRLLLMLETVKTEKEELSDKNSLCCAEEKVYYVTIRKRE